MSTSRAVFHEISALAAGPTPDPVVRLPAFVGMEDAALASLRALEVLLIGLGSVGFVIADALARLGVGALWLVDCGHFKPASVLTHPIDPAWVGRPKASTAGAHCKRLRPELRVHACDGRAQDLPLATLPGDLVALATDRLAPEVWAGQAALHLGRPFLQASVHGATLYASARTLPNTAGGQGPCPMCAYDREERARLEAETRFSCDGSDAPAELPPAELPATRSVSFLCAQAANLLLFELLRHVLRLGRALEDQIIEYCAYTHEIRRTPLSRNPECPCEHVTYTGISLPHAVAGCGLAELVHISGAGDLREVAVAVDQHVFIDAASCACTPQRDVRRFLHLGGSLGTCADCGTPVVPNTGTLRRVIPGSELDPHLPLAHHGAATARGVLVRGPAGAFLLRAAAAAGREEMR